MSVSPSPTLLIANVRPASQFLPHTLSVSLTIWTTSHQMDAEMLSTFTKPPCSSSLVHREQEQAPPVLHPNSTGLFIFEKYWSMIGMQSPLSPSVSQRCVHVYVHPLEPSSHAPIASLWVIRALGSARGSTAASH